MTRLIKHRPPAQPPNFLIQRLRAFDFDDSHRARMLGQNFAPEENHQDVAPNYLTAIVDDANAIPIPIQPDAHVCMFSAHCHDEVTQVFRLNRIGMVVRKPGIRVAKSRTRSTPKSSRTWGAMRLAVPLPQSSTTLSRRGPSVTFCCNIFR